MRMLFDPNRLTGRLFYCLIALLVAAAAAHAQAPATTQVEDVIYRPDGTPVAGTLLISWPAFNTSENRAVAAGSMRIAIGEGGAVSVRLAPNVGADPAGTYYKVVLQLDDGSTSEEYWSVPAAGPVSIAAIRAKIVPAGIAASLASRTYVDQEVGRLANMGPVADIRFYGAKCDGTTNDLAAVRAAITALTPGGGTLTGNGDCYLQATSGTEALLITAPISLRPSGKGQWTLYFNVPDGMDWVRVAPAAVSTPLTQYTGSTYYYFRNVKWEGVTLAGSSGGTVVAQKGRHAINLDCTNGELYQFNWRGMNVFDTKTGYGVYMNNLAGAGQTNGCWLVSTVENSQIWNGMYLNRSGDSLVFTGNKFHGKNDGLYIASIAGAGKNVVASNNFTTAGAPVVVDAGADCIIRDNEMGISRYLPVTATATIDIRASAGPVYNCKVRDNLIGLDQENPGVPNVKVGAQAYNTQLSGNTFKVPPGQPAIVNAGFATEVAPNNLREDEVGGSQLLSTAAGSVVASQPVLQGIAGVGELENRLKWPEDLTNGAWVKSQQGAGALPTVTQTATALPDGSSGNASRVQLSLGGGTSSSDRSIVEQTVSGLANPHVALLSVWLKSNVPGQAYTILVSNNAAGSAMGQAVTVRDAWVRVFIGKPPVVNGAADTFRIALLGGGTYSPTADILVWGAQISSNKTGYTKTENVAEPLGYGFSGDKALANVVRAMQVVRLGSAGDTGLSRTAAGVVAAGNGAAGDASGVFRAAAFRGDGSSSAPAHAFQSETNTGWYFGAAGDARFALAGSASWRVRSSVFQLGQTTLQFSTGIADNANDPRLTRAANTLSINAPDAAAAINLQNAGATKLSVGTGGTSIGGGAAIVSVLSGTASLDFDFSGAGITCHDLTIAVTGAADGDTVALGLPNALASTAGVQWTAWVSAANTVTVRGCDVTTSNLNPGAATVRATVVRF